MEGTPSPFSLISPRRAWRYVWLALAIISILLVVALCWLWSMSRPPENFPVATPIEIKAGSSVASIVKTFKEANVVRSELLLYMLLLSQYEPSDIKASTYVFDQPYDAYAIANKLATGDFTSNLVRLTHREGERVSELAPLVSEALPNISPETFLNLALPDEGYLFPETYFLPPHYTAEEVIATLKNSYEAFIAPHREAIAKSSLTEAEIVTLASIVEREANSEESMKMVAGILRYRLEIDMPLQADASMEYVLDKTLGSLTAEDLKTDSPYNTYLNRGLPPTPIGNPGAMAIEAVLYPTSTDYLFYITGDDGNFYYAKTFEEHKRNIAKYLR